MNNAMLNTNPPESLRDTCTYVTPEIPAGLDVDGELAYLQEHAREYIRRMYFLIFEKGLSE